jgi:hypothetical protein
MLPAAIGLSDKVVPVVRAGVMLYSWKATGAKLFSFGDGRLRCSGVDLTWGTRWRIKWTSIPTRPATATR